MKKVYSHSRTSLMKKWGPECILRCCRDWPSHVMVGYPIGSCGICRQKPTLVPLDWDGDPNGSL